MFGRGLEMNVQLTVYVLPFTNALAFDEIEVISAKTIMG